MPLVVNWHKRADKSALFNLYKIDAIDFAK